MNELPVDGSDGAASAPEAPTLKIYTESVFRGRQPLLILATLLLSAASLAQATKPTFSDLAARANAARDANQLTEARSLYRRALALDPRWAEGWWSLGTIAYDANSYADAARSFAKLVSLQPDSGSAHVMLGLCEFELGQDDAALASLQQGQRLGVSSEEQLRPVVLYHEGILLQRKGRFESAEEVLGQLCRQSPYPPEVQLAIGAIALRNSSRQLPADGTPDNQVMRQVGDAACLGIQRQYQVSGEQFDAILKARPDYPGIHSAYGKMLLNANDTDGAVKQFQAELALNPNDANSLLRIASAKYRIDSAGGLPYAEKAVKLDPNLPLGHYLLGLLLLDTDNYTSAVPELEIAQKAFPDQPKVYFALASAYSRAGRTADAARARQKVVELNKAQQALQKSDDPSLPEARPQQ